MMSSHMTMCVCVCHAIALHGCMPIVHVQRLQVNMRLDCQLVFCCDYLLICDYLRMGDPLTG